MKDLRGNDYIDSEDVIENIDELENDIQTLTEELDELIQEIDTLEEELNDLSSQRKSIQQVLGILDSNKTEQEDDGESLADIISSFEPSYIEDTTAHLRKLESEIETLEKGIEKAKGFLEEHQESISETEEELKPYKDLAEQCQNYGEWKYGTRLIRRREFKNYAQELAEDVGAVDENAKWPMNCIDWDQAANELEDDYSSVDFDGEEYLMRD